MAGITGSRRWDMRAGFTGSGAAIVAGGATAGNDSGMTEGCGYPARGPMTGITGGRGLYVNRRLLMAGRTAARNDTRVTECGGNPGRGSMAGIATFRGLDMCGVLAPRSRAIVASDATTGRHIGMVEPGRYPGGHSMTAVAGGSGLNMVGRFAQSGTPIMTIDATTRHDAGMREARAGPSDRGQMTLAARQGCLYVVKRFGRACQAAALGVAEHAFFGGAFEYAIYMAGLALGLACAPVRGKPVRR